MHTYTITYTDGGTDTIQAARIDWDTNDVDRHYRALDNDGNLLLVAHFHNVRSIRRHDGDTTAQNIAYPHQDGDVIVLGPEVFASADGHAISWKGTNYTRRAYSAVTG